MVRLSKETVAALPQLLSLLPKGDPHRGEEMLRDLVLNGFLEQSGVPALSEYPKVSVIVPVRNRPEEIADCLESLTALSYPADRLEIIVVDDASTDPTPHTAAQFPVRLIRLRKHRQAPFCRNLGAREATGDILAFVDSDCLADSNWLLELAPAFRFPSVGAVGGKVEGVFHHSGLDRYEAVNSALIMGRRAMRSGKRDPSFYVPSCNLLVKRDLFLGIGGFRESLLVGEDVDLCWRIVDQGFTAEFHPLGRVFHKHRNRIRPFCARRFDYGTSEPLLEALHPDRIKRLRLPPGGAVSLGLGILALLTGAFSLLFLCGVIALGDAGKRWRRLHQQGIPLGPASILCAVLREYSALAHNACAFVSRYYLLWALIFFPLFPTACLAVLAMHLWTAIAEAVIKRPHLNFPTFFLYFTLDQAAYQAGVWWGCLKYRAFGSVNPVLAWAPFSKKR